MMGEEFIIGVENIEFKTMNSSPLLWNPLHNPHSHFLTLQTLTTHTRKREIECVYQ